MLQTGIGPDRLRTGLNWLFSTSGIAPSVLISAGFAGALSDELHVGDIVIPRELADRAGQTWPATWTVPANAQRLLTVPRMVAGVEEKRALGRCFAAQAVDMESAVAAEMCASRGLPFGCVRAVSDDAATPLDPRLAALLSRERVSWLRLLGLLCRRPSLLAQCRRLARDTHLAAHRLRDRLVQIILSLPTTCELG